MLIQIFRLLVGVALAPFFKRFFRRLFIKPSYRLSEDGTLVTFTGPERTVYMRLSPEEGAELKADLAKAKKEKL